MYFLLFVRKHRQTKSETIAASQVKPCAQDYRFVINITRYYNSIKPFDAECRRHRNIDNKFMSSNICHVLRYKRAFIYFYG